MIRPLLLPLLAVAGLLGCKADPAKERTAEEREEREEERVRRSKQESEFREKAPKGVLGPADREALYALGALLGTRVAPYALAESELSLVEKGFADSARARKLDLQDPDLEVWGPKVEAVLLRRANPRLGAEKEKGRKALEAEAALPGAQRLPSGVVVRLLKSGSGPSPAANEKIRVKYEGRLVSGEVFDSSPGVELPLGQVIQCWRDGVPKLQVGGSARLTCPPQTAYGDQGQPPRIPGGAALVFEIELLGVAGR